MTEVSGLNTGKVVVLGGGTYVFCLVFVSLDSIKSGQSSYIYIHYETKQHILYIFRNKW